MKNLFVVHTQYNLILSIAAIEENMLSNENHLILFRDFNIDKRMVSTLKTIFKSVKVCIGSYDKNDQTWRKKIVRYSQMRKEFEADIVIYDRVFIVEDTTIPEQYIMRHSYKKNKSVKFECIGDGGYAYFTNEVERTGLAKHGYTMLLRKVLFKYVYGLGKFYTAAWCFGTSPLLETIYEIDPDYLRKELKGKKTHEIQGDYLRKAVCRLYSYLPLQRIDTNCVIIMLDKLTVYGDFRLFDRVINEVVEQAKGEGKTIYYKYHPAEKNIYPGAKEWIELDRNISAEYVFANVEPEFTWVVGIMTTALQTAVKMGHHVTSYIESFASDRKEVINLYREIGIEVK